MPRLQGGQQGESEKTFTIPYFHSGVKAVEFQSKNTYLLRLLPAFDPQFKPEDEGYKTGFMPYRDVDLEADTAGNYPFSQWYFPVPGYKFLGNGGHQFLSPLAGRLRRQKGIDPVYDCCLHANRADDWKYLLEKPEGERNSTLPWPREFAIMNVLLLQEDNTLANFLAVCTSGSLTDLKAKLNQRAGRGDIIISPDWQDYLYGDVTNPFEGLRCTVKEGVINSAGMKTACFNFSNVPSKLDGFEQWPIDPATETGAAFLAGRYDIADTDRVTKIATGQEIMDIIVADCFLPYEFIQEACPDCEEYQVPPAPVRKQTTVPGRQQQETPPITNRPAGVGGTRTVAPTGQPATNGAAGSTRPPGRPPVSPAPAAAPTTANPASAGAARPTAMPTARPATPSGLVRPAGVTAGAARPAGLSGAATPLRPATTLPPGVAASRPASMPATTRPATTRTVAAPAAPAQTQPEEDNIPMGDAQPAADVAPAATGLTADEQQEFDALQVEFDAAQGQIDPEKLNRMIQLGSVGQTQQ